MIANLTQTQMEETRTQYAAFHARVQKAVEEGVLTPKDAKAFSPYSPDLDDYIIKHEDGVYEYVNWYTEGRRDAFSWELDEYTFSNDFREIMDKRIAAMDNGEEWTELAIPNIIKDYGTCDSFDQVWEAFPELLTDPRHFILHVTKVHKKNQSERDGWRWEKNGPYLGNKSEGYDYLYDEPNIDFVWVFQIVRVEPEG